MQRDHAVVSTFSVAVVIAEAAAAIELPFSALRTLTGERT